MVQAARAKRHLRGIAALSVGALLGLALPSSALIFVPTVRAQTEETHVRLFADGVEREWKTRHHTVAQALAEAQVELGPHDEVTPPSLSPLLDGITIQVVRVTRREVTKEEKLPYKTVFRRHTRRYRRQPMIAAAGKPGLAKRTYEVISRDGAEVARRPIGTQIVKAPVDQIVTLRSSGSLPSRGYFGGRRVFRMSATGYDPGPGSCPGTADGITAIGMRAGKGVVAVDPNVIPLRARLFIEGYGHAVAGDVGGAIKGNRIDLGFNTRREALRWGRRPVTVWVLD